MIAVQHTAERVGREHVGQRGGRGDKGSEPFPARPGGDYPVQGRAIVLRSKQGKETQLLPAASHSQLAGEVLLPDAGTCVARWHNPSGWFFSTNATLQYIWSLVPSPLLPESTYTVSRIYETMYTVRSTAVGCSSRGKLPSTQRAKLDE